MNVGENSVVRNWESVAFQPRLLPPSPTLALWDGDSSWDCCRQEHRTPSSLPPARGFSCWEEQDFSMSHPVPSSLLLKLSPQWLCGEVGAAFPPCSWNGVSRILGLWSPMPQLVRWTFHTRRGKLRGPQVVSPPSPTGCSAATAGVSQRERSLPLSLPTALES